MGEVDVAGSLGAIDEELATLMSMRQNVERGDMIAFRDEDSRLVFRLTDAGRARVEAMGKGERS